MDLFGDLMNAVTGATGAAAPAPAPAANLGPSGVVGALIGLLGSQGGVGGLSGLVQKFEQMGLGHLIGSWIGTGQNLPISADQVQSVLGSGRLAQLAQQAGIPPEQASSMIAAVLPGLIDRLTPNGTVDHGLLEQGLDILRSRLA